jgi:PAS domain S-box-containing protein
MVRISLDGRILDSNPAFSQLVGRSAGELRGLMGQELLASGEDLRSHSKRWERLLSGQAIRYRDRVLAVRGDRRLLYAEVNAWLVRDGQSRPSEAVCSLRPVVPADTSLLSVQSGLLLTVLEARILEGLAAGMTNRTLARLLHLSRQGVDYHLAQLRRKLQAESRCSLVARAYALGLLIAGVWPPRLDDGVIDCTPHVPHCRRPKGSTPLDTLTLLPQDS